MTVSEIRVIDAIVGEYGKDIIVDTGQDLTNATTLELHYRKPDKPQTTGVWNATIFPTDPCKLYYTTQANDIDIRGVWTLHAVIVLPGPPEMRLYGELITFRVFDPHERLT